MYILSFFSSIFVSPKVLLSLIPFTESGLILLKARIISFFKLFDNVSGQVTEIIKLVSVCSIRHIGRIAYLNILHIHNHYLKNQKLIQNKNY